MSGRLEKDNLIEEKIKILIEQKPSIIVSYSKSFGNKTVNTKYVYIKHAINFCDYLKREFNINIGNFNDIKNINYSHITSYMDYIKDYDPYGNKTHKEAGTCAAEFYAVKHFCKYLKRCRYIDYNPCDEFEVPKDKKEKNIISLTPEEIQIVKNNIFNGVGSNKAKAKQAKWKTRDLCMIFLGITTGLRVSAISNIDIDDIDLDNKTLKTIEKGNYTRTIFLSDKMVELIQDWIKDRERIVNEYGGCNNCNALFISSNKQRIGVATIRDILKKYTYNINKHITPHKLRSTAATNLYDATGDIYLVADVLGHHNIQNTKRYAKMSTHRRKFAANTLSKLM